MHAPGTEPEAACCGKHAVQCAPYRQGAPVIVFGAHANSPLWAHTSTPCNTRPCHQVVLESEQLDGPKDFLEDKVIIQSDAGDYELVVKAHAAKPDVSIEGELQFGLLPLDSKASKKFRLINNGSGVANVRLDWDK